MDYLKMADGAVQVLVNPYQEAPMMETRVEEILELALWPTMAVASVVEALVAVTLVAVVLVAVALVAVETIMINGVIIFFNFLLLYILFFNNI